MRASSSEDSSLCEEGGTRYPTAIIMARDMLPNDR